PKKYAKMRPKGLRPLGTPFDEGLAVLGGEGVRHRKALLTCFALGGATFLLRWAMLLHHRLEKLRNNRRRTSKIQAQPRTNIPNL
ncbi:MAG: hypothetical protein FWC72_07890, partial [Oscillospiraceae bacterium]|nr:hypothetical protein [Oscillospiraceae bacterium]